MAVRILLVDDQRLILDGLKTILELEPDFEVVGTATSGREALGLVARLHPDVILMDLKMPEMDGVTATRQIKQIDPETKIVILTMFDDDDYVFSGVAAGAMGYVMKDVSADELIQVVRAVAAGGAIIAPSVAAKILREFGRLRAERDQGRDGRPREASARREESEPRPPLTAREWQILHCLARGRTNKEIAQELSIAEGTVKNHISNIFDKLHLRDRTQVAVFAAKHAFWEQSDPTS